MTSFKCAAALLIGSFSPAAAHGCADGSGVVCTEVNGTSGAPTSLGGKQADGFPLTDPANGQTLYCLVRHSYHQCTDGLAACCQDGSDPSHKHKHDTGLVVGVSVGGGLLLLCLSGVGGCYFLKRRRSKGAREKLGDVQTDSSAADEEAPDTVRGNVVSVQDIVAEGTPVAVQEDAEGKGSVEPVQGIVAEGLPVTSQEKSKQSG